jgi:membrane protein YqaA with SNARE-associated domain
MLKRLYDFMMRKASDRRAPHALFWISFAESSFFPIPPDLMLVPMVIANRAKAWWYATIATVGSVIGGIAGYAIGYFLLETVGKPLLALLGYGGGLEKAGEVFREWGVWILIAKGWTPIPYKVLTIAAGAFQMNLLAFVLASIVARAMRFYLVAGLLYYFGEPIREFIEKRLMLVTTAAVVLIVAGFVAIKLLVK